MLSCALEKKEKKIIWVLFFHSCIFRFFLPRRNFREVLGKNYLRGVEQSFMATFCSYLSCFLSFAWLLGLYKEKLKLEQGFKLHLGVFHANSNQVFSISILFTWAWFVIFHSWKCIWNLEINWQIVCKFSSITCF